MLLFRPSDEQQNGAVYNALQDDEVCGRCVFTYSGFEMRVTGLECDDDMIKEGLLRSVMNYCANRNAFVCMIDADMLCPAAERLGFSKNNLTVEIPDALASTCCHCSK